MSIFPLLSIIYINDLSDIFWQSSTSVVSYAYGSNLISPLKSHLKFESSVLNKNNKTNYLVIKASNCNIKMTELITTVTEKI